MGFVTKTVVRVAVVGALVGGAALVIAGPHRVKAVLHQATSNIRAEIDSHIDDPVALRAQLRELQAQYPDKIAEVKGDLAELQGQTRDLERELAVSKRVVVLASGDLDELQALIARGEEAQGKDGFRVVRLRFEDRSINLDQAYTRVNAIGRFRSAHAARTADISRDLDLLSQQETRLTDLLGQLEGEQAEFETQLWQLDRQVDAIARNDRMIDLLQKRQKTIDKYDRYSADSLGEVQTKIAKLLAGQESKIAALGQHGQESDYVEQAEAELDLMLRTGRSFMDEVKVEQPEPDVVEIAPEEGTRVLGRLN